jgi:hypothetical protein
MDFGNITFDVPDDFTPLTENEIALKFPNRNGPIEAIGNAKRGVTVSYVITKTPLRPDQLPDLEAAMETNLPKIAPSLQWIKKDTEVINGTKWVYFEFITQTPDGGLIHNIELFTSYRDFLTILNFNSTTKLFGVYEPGLRAAIQSIKIKNPTGG